MFKYLFKLICILLLLISFFALSSSIYAHDITSSYSEWYLNENNVDAVMYFDPLIFIDILNIDEITDETSMNERLHKAIPIYIQPYVDKKISIWINGKKIPFTVKEVMLDYVGQVQLKCSTDNLNDIIKNVKIDYRLFFEETNNYHRNFASIVSSPNKEDAIEFIFGVDSPTWEGSIKGRLSIWSSISQFIFLGIEHILTGYDHILFLLALIVIGLSFKEVLRIITSFTIAHSITLFLSALHIISLNYRFVESVIALSICYVALENIIFNKANYRWLVAFGFGLIHGFGFASMLEKFTITRENLIYSVLSFNVGVELGQLIIFLVVLPFLTILNKNFNFRIITVSVSIFVFLMGFVWLIERLFAIKIFALLPQLIFC